MRDSVSRMVRRQPFSRLISLALAVGAAVEGVAVPFAATTFGAFVIHESSLIRHQGLPACKRIRAATPEDWLVDPESFVVALRESNDSLLVRVTPQFADWATVSATAGGYTWDCSERGTGWGIRVPPGASSQWNALLASSHLDSLATTMADAEAVALVFLSFALAEPLVTAAPDSGALGRARVDFGRSAWRGPPVSIAVYWAEDSWVLNGWIGTDSDYMFQVAMGRSGTIRSVRLALRHRD